MATSSEEGPNLALLYNVQQPQRSDESDLPDWIQSHVTPCKDHVATYVSSDDGSDDVAGPSSRADRGPNSGTAAAAADGAPSASQQPLTTPSGKSAAAKASSSAAAAAAAAGPLAPAAGRSAVQLILPEKLIRNKVLLELEPAPHQATELSGDAGAVGRLVVSSLAADDGCFKLDLKGVLYQATVLPLSGTALVVNMGPTEAKVESVLNDFVRLREECSYHDMGVTVEGGAGMDEFMADDEDVYQLGNEAKDAGEKAAKKAAKPRSKAGTSKAGTSKATAASKTLKPAKAGVKKKPTKSKSAAKGGKGSAGAKAKATPKKAKAAAAPKAKPAGKPKAAAAASAAKKKKKKHSDSDDEDDWDSDWSG